MNRYLLVFLVAISLFCLPVFGETTAQLGGMDSSGDYYWTIDSDGVLTGGTGATISLGGVAKGSWGDVISPWEDDGTTTTLTSAPTKFILTHSTGTLFSTIGDFNQINLENDAAIDNAADGTVTIVEGGDTLSLVFTGNDVEIENSDGGIIFDLNDATAGDSTVDFMLGNDDDDYIQFSTTTNQPLIHFVDCDGKITATDGAISFDNENVSTSGTFGAGATTVTSLIIGDDTIDVVTDDQMRFASNDEESTIEAYGFEAKDGVLQLTADQGDDAGDKIQLVSDQSTNSLFFTSDTAAKDTHATILTLAKTGLLTTTGDIYVVNDTATTNAVVDVLKLEVTSTGTAAAGLGVGVVFSIEDEATTPEEQASLDVAVTDSTDSAENADLIASLNTIGTIREVLRIDTDCTATAATAFELTSWTIETNGVMNVLELVLENTADTATDGYGMAISFQLEDETGVEERASLDIVQTDGARASNDTDFIFSQDVAGTMTERVRFDADANNILLSGATPGITIGDDGAEDTNITFDGSVNEFYVALDDTGGLAEDALVIGLGTAVGTTPILGFNATQQMILEEGELFYNTADDTVSFASDDSDLILALKGVTDKDVTIVFDGTAQDFYVGVDDTDDDLNIGLGTAPGTTPAIEIDEDLNVIVSISMKTPYQIVAATETLTENESMKLIVLNHATEFATTLPDVASSAGVTFHIVVGAAPAAASYTVVTEGGEDKISGIAVVNGASVAADTEDTITFTDGAAVVGDWVELTCDGVLWYVSGQAVAATGIVFTKT